MTDQTAKPHGGRRGIEQVAEINFTPAQQICHWTMAHRLDAYRVCGAFRIDELGLTDLRSALRSRRQPSDR